MLGFCIGGAGGAGGWSSLSSMSIWIVDCCVDDGCMLTSVADDGLFEVISGGRAFGCGGVGGSGG